MNLHVWAPGFAGFGGGIGVFSREFALSLRMLGHDVRLAGKFDRPGKWGDMPLWGAGNFPSALRSAAFAAGTFAACRRDRPDQIISTHVNFGPVANLAKKSFGTRFTLIAHGIDVHNHLSNARTSALRAADRIVAVSSWTRGRLLELPGIDASRISILPNTVDETRFFVGARPPHLVKRYAIEPDEQIVLTVARLDPSEVYVSRPDRHFSLSPDVVTAGHKGCDRLLQALPAVRAACGRVRYVIVGKGADRSRLEALARQQGVLDVVTFAGFVPDEELADHYRLADVFAMPSTSEGFGIVFLEAMACGTPVLAGNLDGSVDALGGGELGKLVNPNDVDAIAIGLISLLRRQGPAWWFDRVQLHDAVIRRFGYGAFRDALREILT